MLVEGVSPLNSLSDKDFTRAAMQEAKTKFAEKATAPQTLNISKYKVAFLKQLDKCLLAALETIKRRTLNHQPLDQNNFICCP